MKTILIAWELGGGLGHLLQLAPVVKGLAQRGHRVVLALKDLSRARAVFPEGVQLLQAPVKTRTEANAIQAPMTFAIRGRGGADTA